MTADWNKRWAPATRQVAHAETENFSELINIGGLDPREHLRFADWADLSFAQCKLNGFDFTGALLAGCDFTGAKIAGARFDGAIIDRLQRHGAGTSLMTEDGSLIRTADSTLVTADSILITTDGTLVTEDETSARRTDLRAAADWDAHVAGWRRPARLIGDAHLPVGAVFQDAPFAPELVAVPPGELMMGSPPDEPERFDNEAPHHLVTIADAFAVGRYAVTFDEWDFAQADKDWRKITRLKARKARTRWGRGNRPVIDVSWEDAQAYVKWLSAKTGRGYRLPSEAEWEYVARAGTATPFWWGSSITPAQANYDGSEVYHGGKTGAYRGETVPVDKFAPNAFGLYQVHGNVWEWVEDKWHAHYDGAPVDGSAWTTGDSDHCVLRGGSWYYGPWVSRAASRKSSAPSGADFCTGFRVSRTLNP